jgi:hypothetical protein
VEGREQADSERADSTLVRAVARSGLAAGRDSPSSGSLALARRIRGDCCQKEFRFFPWNYECPRMLSPERDGRGKERDFHI